MIQLKIQEAEGLSEQDAWDKARTHIAFDPARALGHRYVQVIDSTGTVLAVARLDGVSRSPDDITERMNVRRYTLEGGVLAGHERVGRATKVSHTGRNNLMYGTAEQDNWLSP